MNYSKLYELLVKSRLYRPIKKTVGYELHHIVPRSLGGSNDNTNLVLFTPREHFIAHLLLFKMSKDQNERIKMINALNMMSNTRDGIIIKSSRLYESYRLNYTKFHVSKSKEWKYNQSVRQKEVMKDRVHMHHNGKNKLVKRQDIENNIAKGWKLGWVRTKSMIDGDKKKSITCKSKCKRKIDYKMFTDIKTLYEARPFINLDFIVKHKSKHATAKIIYEREFCKIYSKQFNITPNGMYGIITGKVSCPPQ